MKRRKKKEKKKELEAAVYKQRREMRWLSRNKITSWVKIGPPWSHFKASLMILISRNGILCRQTKKKRMRAKKKVVLE